MANALVAADLNLASNVSLYLAAKITLGVALVMWLAARIYRVGILMYGKKPTLPEIFRWALRAD